MIIYDSVVKMLTKLVKIETGLDALTFTSKASSGTSINVRTIAYNVVSPVSTSDQC
ncbi:unnamed protein product [Onchocerca flexuosa]|uniref:Phage protein n=1 Tax=Onchocerca flexuosa TaxID=387005 RepID=A0A183I0Z2_9BILA|nr:unnamed protein product [Onchocerca flexuosa]